MGAISQNQSIAFRRNVAQQVVKLANSSSFFSYQLFTAIDKQQSLGLDGACQISLLRGLKHHLVPTVSPSSYQPAHVRVCYNSSQLGGNSRTLDMSRNRIQLMIHSRLFARSLKHFRFLSDFSNFMKSLSKQFVKYSKYCEMFEIL